MTMKSLTTVARAIVLDASISVDLSKGLSGDEAKTHKVRAAFLTPIAKAFGTDTGCEVAEIGVQVHGGMGYIEETGAAQYYRDVRVTAIYEGTNGIHAMDMVGRKLMDDGAAAFPCQVLEAQRKGSPVLPQMGCESTAELQVPETGGSHPVAAATSRSSDPRWTAPSIPPSKSPAPAPMCLSPGRPSSRAGQVTGPAISPRSARLLNPLAAKAAEMQPLLISRAKTAIVVFAAVLGVAG